MKVRACRLIQNQCLTEIRKAYDKYKLNFSDFQRKLNKCVLEANYEEYSLYIKHTIIELLDKEVSPDNIERLSANLDNYYIQIMSRYFIVNAHDVKNICDMGQEIDYEKLDTMGDFFIEFNNKGVSDYAPVVVKVCKSNYTITTKRFSDMYCWNCSVLYYEEKQEKVFCRFTFSFNQELTHKYLVDLDRILLSAGCKECKNCTVISAIVNQGEVIPADFCIVNNRKIENGNCDYFDKVFNPQMLLNLIAYVSNMYTDRRNLSRKNSRNANVYNKHKIHVATETEKSKDVILDLNRFYQYEREHKEWQGGHHNSPVEHVRRSHTRIYRNPDGSIRKIVPIDSVVVNAGGKKGVYRV